MTLEELRTEAKKMGYGLHKLQEYVSLEICPGCGKRPVHYASKLSGWDKYRCKCGLETEWCKTDRKARRAWNAMMEATKEAAKGKNNG